AARTAEGVLAGSILTLDHAVRNWTAMTEATLAEALFAASEAPAAVAGRCDPTAAGAPADLVLLDRGGASQRVMRGGKWLGARAMKSAAAGGGAKGRSKPAGDHGSAGGADGRIELRPPRRAISFARLLSATWCAATQHDTGERS